MMTGAPQMLNLRLDQMLMAALLPARDLGLYVVAVAWSSAAAPLLSAIGAVMAPAVASAADQEQGTRRMAQGVRGTATLALALCLPLEVMTPLAIAILFGGGFKESIPAALVLVPAAGVLGLNLALQEGLRGMGRPYAALQAESGGLIVTTIVLAVTLRRMGMMGAAIASLLGYTTVCLVLLFKMQQICRMSLSTFLCPNIGEIRSIFNRIVLASRAKRLA
jgi:O-antigen/teichoic acid export membrane protein